MSEDARQIAKVAKTLQARMAVHAIRDLQNLDVRNATILRKLGLITYQPPTIDVVLAAALNDTASMGGKAAGPIFFYKVNGDEARQYAVPLAALVISDHAEIRLAAARRIKAMLNDVSVGASEACRRRIEAQYDLLSNEQESQWVDAAVAIYDALQGDFMVNLAAVNQSLRERYNDGLTDYVPRLLRPTLEAIDGLSLRAPRPTQQRDEIRASLLKFARELDDNAACEAFARDYGFLPLAPELAIVPLVEEWQKRGQNHGQIWATLCNWVEAAKSPLSQFHVSAFLLSHPEFVPHGGWDRVMKTAMGVIDLQRDDSAARRWRLRSELAKHYTEYMEARVPGGSSEMIASVGLMLAEKVSEVLEQDEQFVEKFMAHMLRQEAETSSFSWRIASAQMDLSDLSMVVHSNVSPWSLGLIAQAQIALRTNAFADVDEAIQEAFVRTLATHMLYAALRNTLVTSNATYSFDVPLTETAKAWLSVTSASDASDVVRNIVSMTENLQGGTGIIAALETVAEQEGYLQILIISCLGYWARLEKVDSAALWNLLNREDWRKTQLLKLEGAVFELFYWAVSALQRTASEEWRFGLPHLYASACEESSADEEKDQLLFAFTMFSAFSSYSSSAIDRLLKGAKRHTYDAQVKHWREVLAAVLPSAPAWVLGRTRALRSALYVD